MKEGSEMAAKGSLFLCAEVNFHAMPCFKNPPIQIFWWFWIVMLEKTLGSPLNSTEIKPVNPKGNQRLIFIGRTDAEADAPVLWPPDAKSRLTGKDALMLGKMENKRRRGQQRIRWLHSNTNSVDMNLSKLWERVKDRGAWHAAVHGVTELDMT